MKYYLCKLIGAGTPDDPVRPCIANHISKRFSGSWWKRLADARTDLREKTGYMIIFAGIKTRAEQNAIDADPDITLLGDETGVREGALDTVATRTGETVTATTVEEALEKLNVKYDSRSTFR